MSLRIRRGTEAQRSGITFDIGELVWTTDGQKLYVGNGLTQGGIDVAAQLAGENLAYNETTGKLDFAGASYTTDDIPAGSNQARQYFSTESAQDAAASLLTSGVHTNITFTYTSTQDGANRIDAAVSMDGVGITQVYDDTSPSLGGSLELNNYDITGTGNVDITGTIGNATLLLDGSEITGSVAASTYNASIGTSTNVVAVGSASNPNVIVVNADREGVIVRTNTTSSSGPTIELQATRTSGASLATVVDTDILGVWTTKAYTGSEFKRISVIQTKATSNVSGGNLNSDLELSVLSSTGDYSQFTFKSTGLFATAGVSFTPLTSVQVTGVNTFAPVGSIGYNSDEKTLQLKTGASFVSVSTVTSVPAYSDSTGKIGQIAGDANYVYFCYAANSWTRVAKDGTFGTTPP